MKLLALYRDDNGNAQSAYVTLIDSNGNDPDLLTQGEACVEAITSELDNYNDGGGLFLVTQSENLARSDVADENGAEVGCTFLEITLEVESD